MFICISNFPPSFSINIAILHSLNLDFIVRDSADKLLKELTECILPWKTRILSWDENREHSSELLLKKKKKKIANLKTNFIS